MKKVLFLIPTLGHGGAEKVLVNLVRFLDADKFEITVMTLYDEGINRQFLPEYVTYRSCRLPRVPGIAHMLKLMTPERLYRRLIKDRYDIAVSYLEGQTARIISGCPWQETRLLCWIHKTMLDETEAARLFRSVAEARACYARFDRIVCVSQDVKQAFQRLIPLHTPCAVAYNVSDTEWICQQARETVPAGIFRAEQIHLCAMGTIFPVKGFERLVHIHCRLREQGYPVHTYLLGEGSDRGKIEAYLRRNGQEDSFTFLGYQTNPYAYLARCELFVCSSYSEGFSTAVTEALTLGIPVITTQVSGMRELLGEHQEYGMITENEEESLYRGVKKLLDGPALLAYYKDQAILRGKSFQTEETVRAAERLLQGEPS